MEEETPPFYVGLTQIVLIIKVSIRISLLFFHGSPSVREKCFLVWVGIDRFQFSLTQKNVISEKTQPDNDPQIKKPPEDNVPTLGTFSKHTITKNDTFIMCWS